MCERFEADTQYSDLIGTNAFDGHDGPPFHDLATRANMPAGYFAVGFELFRLHPEPNTGEVPFTLLAVKKDESGNDMAEIIERAQKTNELPVYRFDGMIKTEHFPGLFKRVDIKAVSKSLPQEKIRIRRL